MPIYQLSAQTVKIASPDGQVQMEMVNDDRLSYSLYYKGKQLIQNSSLGFEYKEEAPMKGGFTIINTPKIEAQSETWNPVVKNKHAHVSLKWNEILLQLREKEGDRRQMDLCIRAYNNGVAFRYHLYDGRQVGKRQIVKELTEFSVPSTAKAWVAEYKPHYRSSQEGEFLKKPVTAVTDSTVAGLPFLIEVDKKNYLAITEAYINDYPGFYIGAVNNGTNADSKQLTVKLPPLLGEKEDGVKALFDDECLTPWRVIMVADNPGRFIESEIIQGLNPSCAIENPSWIKPGISAWDHWWSGEVKMEMPVIKEYIDLASSQGWPYMLIDWQWYGPFNKPEADITKPAPQIDMNEILRYAKSKGVKCWLWLYCTDVNKNDAYKKAFALYEKWGIAGIKIDFMDRDDQDMVNWYRRIVKKAAEHKLMVDLHGAYKPDGIERTDPNLLTREGVMGGEYYKWSNRVTPEHNVTLPFTRMLAGPMDYTPGGFLNVRADELKSQTPTQVADTRCAELAKFVVYESPWTVACEHPKNMKGQSGIDFLKIVPTVWDDTRFLDGYPGKYIALAKRSGDRWFVGVLNNSEKRTVKLDTSFLPEGKYTLEYWTDAKDSDKHPVKLIKKCTTLPADKSITVRMVNSGGYVAVIYRNL